jgi:Tfp pilus assembly protein PilP
VPERPDGKACDAKAPDCDDPQHPDVHLYCLPIGAGAFCEPCPERETIRHAFKDRDFAVEQNRDPFQSFVVVQPGLGAGSGELPKDVTKKCIRDDQMVATGYGYGELKLVGIIAQGTQRKVLMMDASGHGHIIKRGDCVGKEKAVVKDIGTGYITFEVDADASAGGARAPEEHSVQLHPTLMDVSAPPSDETLPRTTITPSVPPLPVLPARPRKG